MRPIDKKRILENKKLLKLNNKVNKKLITKNRDINKLVINDTIKTTKMQEGFKCPRQKRDYKELEKMYLFNNIINVSVNNKWNECNIKTSKKPFKKSINTTLISRVYKAI